MAAPSVGYQIIDLAALQAIAAVDRAESFLLFVAAENAWYRFGAAAAQAADGLLVVAPAAGTGRWLRVGGPVPLQVNAQTGLFYTLQLSDRDLVSMSNPAPNTVIVPPSSAAPFPPNHSVDLRWNGVGQTGVAPGAGVFIDAADNKLKLRARHSKATLRRDAIEPDLWWFFGDIGHRVALNPIAYTPAAIGSQNYIFGDPTTYGVQKIVDGNVTNSGMIAEITDGGDFDATLTAASPFYLTRITLYGGQFNGASNGPRRLRLYAETTLNTLLYDTTLLVNTSAAQSLDVSAALALDTPRSQYTMVLTGQVGSTFMSVLELQLFGEFA